jgi:hypothetical protein
MYGLKPVPFSRDWPDAARLNSLLKNSLIRAEFLFPVLFSCAVAVVVALVDLCGAPFGALQRHVSPLRPLPESG